MTMFGLYCFGGPGGIRTLDLSDANRTLSQLSYGPLCHGGNLRLPQNADLLRRKTIDGKSAYRFHYITPCGKNQDFLRIFVPDFGECSAWRESAAGDGSRSNANSPFRGIALTYRWRVSEVWLRALPARRKAKYNLFLMRRSVFHICEANLTRLKAARSPLHYSLLLLTSKKSSLKGNGKWKVKR